MSKQLPKSPSLDWLRSEAKSLLKSIKAGDPTILEAIKPFYKLPKEPKLADAQFLLALYYGFESWPKLKAEVESRTLGEFNEEAIVRSAVGDDSSLAKNWLNRSPERFSTFLLALVAGDFQIVESCLKADPGLVSQKIGPLQATPIVYLCFSKLKKKEDVKCLSLLLRMGSDPNTIYLDGRFPDWPLSVLYGVSGVQNNPEMTEVLLKAGANPTDGESVYHSSEHQDLKCLKLLFEYGAQIKGNDFLRVLDWENLEGCQLMLANGADPNNPPAIVHAIRRGRSKEIIETLLAAGADPNQTDNAGRTPYLFAALKKRNDLAGLFKEDLTEIGKWLINSPDADLKKAQAEAKQNPEFVANLLNDIAGGNQIEEAKRVIQLKHGISLRNTEGSTPLHQACWNGHIEIVKLLLEAGADLEIRDGAHNGTPIGWATHAPVIVGHKGPYAEIVKLLLEAGAELKPDSYFKGDPEIDKVIQDHLAKTTD